MANIKTYDLIECSRLYPTVVGANNTDFLSKVDKYVQLNADAEQSYLVKQNIQARFYAPRQADATSSVKYSVTSIVFNGLETLSAPANLTVAQADNIYIQFPLYAAAPNGYTSNLANAVYTTVAAGANSYFERNFADFMQSLFDTLGINVDITNSHPDWWAVSMKNFMIEMYKSDTLDIEITETYNNVERKLKYSVTGTTAKAYIDGADVTVIPVPANQQPQFGDVWSINSRAVSPLTAVREIDCCPVVKPFYASLSSSCASTLDVNCDCSKITFNDNSVYDNGLIGHDPSYFNHRTITLTRPDGTTYVWSTDGVVDKIITPHWNSNNIFDYNFITTDVDGIYSVKICTYPDWQSTIYYDYQLCYFVYRNGVVYKQVSSSTNQDPALDTSNTYWIPATEADDKGRYCAEQKIVVLCLSIMDCYIDMSKKALCDIGSNPCQSVADNPSLLKAMKMRVTLDALGWAVDDESWDLAKSHIDILKSICCCNG